MMQVFDQFIDLIENNPLADAVRENDVLFPLAESTHILAICLVIGSIFVIDLRLLGLASIARPVGRMTASILPLTWVAFLLALTSGGLMFISNASKYLGNGFFDAKLALIAAAGLNMMIFHLVTGRDMKLWEDRALPPWPARMAGGISLLLWISVVACGRWIGFTMPAL